MRETLQVICPTGQVAFLLQVGATGEMGVGGAGRTQDGHWQDLLWIKARSSKSERDKSLSASSPRSESN